MLNKAGQQLAEGELGGVKNGTPKVNFEEFDMSKCSLKDSGFKET